MIEIEVVLPERSEDPVSDSLRLLTKAIEGVTGEAEGYGLGGKHGYGANYENETFMMHRYCWCEGEDCPWCGEKNAPNFLHKPSGSNVHWYKWIGRSNEVELNGDWATIISECINSLKATDTINAEYEINFMDSRESK